MASFTGNRDLQIDAAEIHDEYDRAGLFDCSDAQLFDRAARTIAVPRRTPANSFVLHAPLELMARRLLLSHVRPHARRAARERIIWVAAKYESASEPVEPPSTPAFASVPEARQALLEAIAHGDLDAVDGAAAWFADAAALDDTMSLAGPTLEMLAAAGHAPIGFFLLSRLAVSSRSSFALLRPLLRELARAPQLRVEWVRDTMTSHGDEASLTDALARTPRLGLPDSDFIFPLVHQVDTNGVACDLIATTIPADISRATVAILRVAARSMLQDDPAFAPYGWTHCLTLPHAILEIIPWLPDPRAAAAIAATYVAAFRAGEARDALDTAWEPERVPTALVDALDADPPIATSAWYHASDAVRAKALPELVARAATHEDAHYAKYTLACLAAAERDREQRNLYFAAAASLAAWWSHQGATTLTNG
jgi:hypothetical protein